MSAIEVKQLREKLGLTQQQLAAKLGVTHSAVCLWERGKREPSKLATNMLRTLDTKKTAKSN